MPKVLSVSFDFYKDRFSQHPVGITVFNYYMIFVTFAVLWVLLLLSAISVVNAFFRLKLLASVIIDVPTGWHVLRA